MRGAHLLVGLLLLGLPECALVLSIEDGVPRSTPLDAGVEAGADTSADVAPDVVLAGDAGTDASGDADAAVARCAAAHGPKMLDVEGKFCIDLTEVTNSQYAAFMASNPSTAGQGSLCSWNTSYVPAAPLGAADLPVGSVDWCDALAYCKYAGKTLCGSATGTAVAWGSFADPTKSAWSYACTHGGDGLHPYAYGVTLDPTACNVSTLATEPVASRTKCEGGYPGLFDMVGNVKEWENCCEPGPDGGPSNDICRRRGGGYNTGLDASCGLPEGDSRDYASSRSGIRCCKY